MATTTFNVRFVVKNEKVDKDGTVPIYAKIWVNGEKLELTCNHRILPADWLPQQGRAKSGKPSSAIINEFLESFKSRIYQAYSKVTLSGREITKDAIRDAIAGKEEKVNVHYLIATTEEHNRSFAQLVGIKYSEGSYKNYRTSLKYYREFVPQFYKKEDIPLELVNYKFCEAFFTFLTTTKECKNNGANKQLQRLKKIIHYAINRGYLSSNPMATYKLTNTPVNKQALTLEELERLQRLELSRQTLIEVRDVFLFQAYTGLAYSDAKRLTANDIQLDNAGDYWVRMQRQKTLISFSVPLLAPALLILEKYFGKRMNNEPLLPMISNQKMNNNLKVIQELAGISKNLTTHLARHTFATTVCLSNGVPIETVSKMLGHTKLATTQIYAKVLEGKIAVDMLALKKKLKDYKEGE